MKNAAKFLGAIGLVFFIYGLIAAFFLGGHLRSIAIGQVVLGLIGCIIFASYYTREALATVSRKSDIFYGALGGAFLLFILIGVNVVAHSKWGEKQFDLTVNKIHSLSEESQRIVRDIQTP